MINCFACTMAEKEKSDQWKVLEADFQKKSVQGTLYIDGVIVYSLREDKFDYLPMEGYPDCPSFSEMTEIEVDRGDMTPAVREETFYLKTPQDTVGSEAKVFLRVEAGKLKKA